MLLPALGEVSFGPCSGFGPVNSGFDKCFWPCKWCSWSCSGFGKRRSLVRINHIERKRMGHNGSVISVLFNYVLMSDGGYGEAMENA